MNNINPKLWGPPAWSFLIYITLSYPDNPTYDDQNNMKNFFFNLGKILPCQKCRGNYINHFNKYPMNELVLKNKQNLIFWLMNVYNEIRYTNGQSPLTFSQIIKKYLEKNNEQSDIKSNIIFVLCLVIVLILLIIFLKFKY